jgi:hypothetical protein
VLAAVWFATLGIGAIRIALPQNGINRRIEFPERGCFEPI